MVGPQSIEETDLDDEIIVVQLPGSNDLKIVSPFEITNLRIINLSGVVRLKRAMSAKEIILDIGFLQRGIYLIEIETRDGRSVRKFSKW